MPPWASQEADVDVVCDLHQRLADVYPIAQLDVIVVGIFHQVGGGRGGGYFEFSMLCVCSRCGNTEIFCAKWLIANGRTSERSHMKCTLWACADARDAGGGSLILLCGIPSPFKTQYWP